MRTQQRLLLAISFGLSLFIGTAVQAESADADIISVEAVELLDDAALRELVSPVALYPDDLLAIVLPASTYPLQIVAAARYREAAETDTGLEPDESWDESIVALLNYPEALAFLNADLNWTWELGQAVLAQQADVLSAVTRFRDEAVAAGNLETDEHQVVATEDEVVTIKSADPEVVYVPYYEPEEVTVYQTERVYHYYPSAYPVYYYPYSYGHRFYDHYSFWGVSSIFLLSWDSHHLSHHYHHTSYHPYYGRTYHRNHFRRTRGYHSPQAGHRRAVHRRNHQNGYRGRWTPNDRYAGARPNYRQQHRRGSESRQRHTRRAPRDQQQFITSRDAVRSAGRTRNSPRNRQSAGRLQPRDSRTVDQLETLRKSQVRSSAHRPRQQADRTARQQANRSTQPNHQNRRLTRNQTNRNQPRSATRQQRATAQTRDSSRRAQRSSKHQTTQRGQDVQRGRASNQQPRARTRQSQRAEPPREQRRQQRSVQRAQPSTGQRTAQRANQSRQQSRATTQRQRQPQNRVAQTAQTQPRSATNNRSRQQTRPQQRPQTATQSRPQVAQVQRSVQRSVQRPAQQRQAAPQRQANKAARGNSRATAPSSQRRSQRSARAQRPTQQRAAGHKRHL